MRERNRRRTEGKAGRQPAVVVSWDEMWTYQRMRRGAQRREVWIWTAVVAEADGCRWVDFEVGDRSETTFLRLYGRLPEAELYRSDVYPVYQSWLPPGRHRVGKGGRVNRNEGLHSKWRGRLRRETTGYSKALWMLRGSLAQQCHRPRKGKRATTSSF